LATRTVEATPAPSECLTWGRKISLALGILRRAGKHEGERGYRARYDVNADGVIDAADLARVLAAPTCKHWHKGGTSHGA
jgi:hypothetical protein